MEIGNNLVPVLLQTVINIAIVLCFWWIGCSREAEIKKLKEEIKDVRESKGTD